MGERDRVVWRSASVLAPACSIAIGSARLPKTITGAEAGALLVELSFSDGCIADVATTLPLPGYTALLRSLLVGRRV